MLSDQRTRMIQLGVSALFVSGILAVDRNYVASLMAIAAFIIYGMMLVRFEITHPAVWLPPFIYLYHYNLVILYVSGYEYLEHPLAILWIGWLSIVTVVLLFSARCHQEQHATNTEQHVPLSWPIVKLGYLIAFGLLLSVCAKYFSSGFTDKIQFRTAESMPELAYAPLWLNLFYAMWFVKYVKRGKTLPWSLITLTGAFTLFATLALGERDIFLSYCAVSLFLVFFFRRPGRVILMGIGLLVAGPLLTALHFLRNIFSRDLSGLEAFGDKGMVLSFLYGEFIAGGRNLDIILSNKQWWHYFYGQTPLWVLQHKLFPGILVETRNSSLWFHHSFLPDWEAIVGGYGFTFSGDGYINFGLIGVVLWHVILAAVIIWLYNRHARSGLFLAVYVVSAPLLVWAMRATILYLPGAALLILKPLVIAGLAELFLRRLHAHVNGAEATRSAQVPTAAS